MANPCPRWSLLLRKFALGKMSAIEVQEVASAAVKSGAATPEMIELQKLGTFGLTKGNCNRDLMRKYFGKMAAPDPWKQACLLQVKEQGRFHGLDSPQFSWAGQHPFHWLMGWIATIFHGLDSPSWIATIFHGLDSPQLDSHHFSWAG